MKLKLMNVKSFTCTECNTVFDIDAHTELLNIINYGMCTKCRNTNISELKNELEKLSNNVLDVFLKIAKWFNVKLTR